MTITTRSLELKLHILYVDIVEKSLMQRELEKITRVVQDFSRNLVPSAYISPVCTFKIGDSNLSM